MGFTSFNFRPEIVAGIQACGYTAPTPIQQQTMPPALAGRDVMGLAQTGTGKTAAFVLPILERLSNGPRGRARALILAPTRELAEQILESVNELGRTTGLRGVAVYGGVSKEMQLQKIRRGVEIMVACPGRLLDHLQAGAFRLDAIEILVLDEGDQMFDMGFLPDIRRIMKQIPARRQNMLFSATMPADIRRLAGDILVDPAEVRIDPDQPAATIAQVLFPVAPQHKSSLLLAILRQTQVESVLVFTRTKHGAKNLARRLTAAGFKAADLQGNLSQNKRRDTLDGFRSGEIPILVATDIAARGLDVARVSHVVNYDMPNTAEGYTHRIGRTGRACRQGEAFSLISSEDQGLVNAIERGLGRRLERRALEGFNPAQAEDMPSAPREVSDRPQGGRGNRPQGAGAGRPRSFNNGRPQGASTSGNNRNGGSGNPRNAGAGKPRNGNASNQQGDKPAGAQSRPRRIAPLGLGLRNDSR
jgi:ATP-dependent RNA helicase RhlE